MPFALKVREITVPGAVTGMLAGAPATGWKVTSCAVPVMLNRTTVPTATVRNAGLNESPGVKTSAVGVPVSPGDVGASLPPEQPEARTMATNPTNLRMSTLRSLTIPQNEEYRTVRPFVPAVRRVPFWMTLTTVVALSTAACSKGDGVTGPADTAPPTPVGAYTLSTVDAKALPWTMYADTGYTLAVQGATLVIAANGTWISKVVTQETVAGYVSTYNDSTFGTWTATASTKTAVLTNAETATTSSAVWTATGVSVTQLDGATTHTFAYRKN